MRDCEISLNPNKLVRYLKKPACEFTKNDIIQFVEDNEIEMINFRYIAEDGRLKTLTFVITGKEHLDSILTSGERVDGSSLFSFVEAGSSDLYVVPRYKTAFVNPFSDRPSLDILCAFYTNEGKPLESAPEYILKKAQASFKEKTGYTFRAMGELEYYLIMPKEMGNLYPARDQAGYHESGPFSNFQAFKDEALELIAMAGGKIKYAHSEVGNFTDDKNIYEQQEIEFLPVPAEDAVDQMVVAKWILRMLADEYGLLLSFAPKITVGKAGSGLHIHMMLEKDGQNMMVEDGKLSDDARKMIAGILDLAEPLTAFGNTIPTSYLRLVPHQEAPTNICWGDRNRSVLVRVPLGWLGEANKMAALENPQDKNLKAVNEVKQTVELRSGDGSADLYHFVAGIIVAAQHGLEMENGLKVAEELYMDVNIFDEEHKDKLEQLKGLPTSCYESADKLEATRALFEANGIFPAGVIDRFVDHLKAYEDKDLSERLYGKSEEIAKLVDNYIHHM
ncbi:glutamine synthetase family protein [Salinivirga cyanobacteriivorans]|uniref:Glutamine synthetase n=1 Tax=Salinivirga cyanobacteriivorans TaxID=1307839 RepID=A0A0S2I2A6_9BACT|nr:glutamine synthetase family protein [Salinivirga cyanobacteriivorans]ALO16172.1 Glutamine synthetase [Salinivirga cyanobacteriivorans]